MNKISERKKIEQIENLPTLPEIANRLMRVINDPTTTAMDVASLISRDPSLTSKVLRLANSAFYGIPRSVTTVHNAVVILGLKVINTMVFSVTVVKLFPGESRVGGVFSRKGFWSHSLACAVLAKLLSLRMRRLTLLDPEECFCAGLIHDIGRLVLDQHYHEDFGRACDLVVSEKIPLVEAERRVMGFSHTDAGDWLTTRWELPQEIRLPLIHHHQPREAPQAKEVCGLVHLADFLSYRFNLGLPGVTPPVLDQELASQLGFEPSDFDAMRTEALEDLGKIRAVLEI